MAASVLPVLDFVDIPGMDTIVATFLFAFGLVFWRTALSDLLDIQGDRIMGRETIPILLGTENTRKMLNYLLGFLAGLLIFSALTNLLPPVALLLLLNIALYFALFKFLLGRSLVDRLFLEALTDLNLVLAGFLCWIFMI
jgi:4-hydroxy-3-methylbut-2-enyl diphosphate reductase